MNHKIIFCLPGNELLAHRLSQKMNVEPGKLTMRRFPDGETYIKIDSEVAGKEVLLVCTLHLPDDKLLPLYFLAKTLKEFGAAKITLVAPYLAYMRQDKRFQQGESITSEWFAKLLSSFVDELITIDPHLHRRSNLGEIYAIPTQVLHAAPLISSWIKANIPNAVLIGPDSESEQWVSEVADAAGVPYVVLEKTRKGDKDVQVSVPHLAGKTDKIPVLVDDIISTARTMIETIRHLRDAHLNAPVCVGVHGIFAEDAYLLLKSSGASRIITVNTIPHETNGIFIEELLLPVLQQ
ncbi:MAG: phosphoribosylpyrophosphate synthetase [Bacteroidetes bacterium 46-16]|nr:MAG: phosphoribosylpyrophosphate synthetase [Bacteroidetes bacterium 46-16]